MDETAPVDWTQLEEVRPEPTCRTVFDSHREDLAEFDTLQPAVNHLYEAYHEAYGPAQRVPDQVAAFVFAYLVELADIASLSETDSEVAAEMPAIMDRHPGEDELDRLIWEEETVPWWLAVRFGVHYSLIIYWMWEADIPLMRRNIPSETLGQIDD